MSFHYLRFAGTDSRSLRLAIEDEPMYTTAQRLVETENVPGRNGDLFFDHCSYLNTEAEYAISAYAKPHYTAELARRAALWLQGTPGYHRLEDSFRPDEFRLAMFNGPLDVEIMLRTWGRAKLTFDCKPQRFLKCGEMPQTITNGSTLVNRWQDAHPLICVHGSGSGVLMVGEYEADLLSIPSAGLTLDCEEQDCYINGTNLNRFVELADGLFPVLRHGESKIRWSGGIESVTILPRWWVL